MRRINKDIARYLEDNQHFQISDIVGMDVDL